MSVTLNNGVCGAILTSLEGVVSKRNLDAMMEPVGMLQALISDPEQPKMTDVQTLDGLNGHKKSIRISYRQPDTTDTVEDTPNCDAGTEKTTKEVLFTPTLYRQKMVRKSEATVRT